MQTPRLGLSTARLTGTGIWGEPTRAVAAATLTRAVELGIRLMLVPAPFGPAADLVRQALHPYPEDLRLAIRLTGAVTGPEVVLARLATPRLALTVAPPALEATARGWQAAGITEQVAILGPDAGPWPPPTDPTGDAQTYYVLSTTDWTAAAEARAANVLLPAATSPREVERLVGQLAPTIPRGVGPR